MAEWERLAPLRELFAELGGSLRVARVDDELGLGR